MNFDDYLKLSAKGIEKQIDATLNSFQKEVSKKDKIFTSLIGQFILSCSGGKRVRGMLVNLGYEIAAGKSNPGIFKPAAAVEIFHTAILAHDDIIDQSELRRGRSSLYKSLGIPQAIILGDLGFFLANKLIAESSFPDKQKNTALGLFNQMMINTGLGELLDIEPKLNEQEQIILVSLLKTASYTFIGPLSLGAILGNANEKTLKAIEKMGKNLGIGYQIQDDILGIFGSPAHIGKSVTSDIEEGKKSLLWWYAIENGGKNERQALSKLYGRGKISKVEADMVRQVFIKTGALDYCRKKALDYTVLAKKLTPDVTSNKKLTKIIEEMTEYLIQRSK